MEKDSNKYNLEEFLRSHLEHYEAGDNGWNVPPDELWEEVKPKIRGKQHTPIFKTFGKYLLLLGVILISLVAITYQLTQNKNEIIKLSRQLESIKQGLSSTSGQTGASDTPANQEEAPATAPGELRTGEQTLTAHPPATSTLLAVPGSRGPSGPDQQIENGGAQAKKVEISEAALQKELPDLKKGGSPEIYRESAEPIPYKGTASTKAISLTKLEKWSPSALPGLEYEDSTTFSIDPLQEARRPVKRPPAVKFSMGYMQVDRFLDTLSDTFEDYLTHRYRGITLGINLEWPLSDRWFLETGINYDHYSAESIHETHFHFSRSGENIPGLGPDDLLIESRLHSAIGHAETQMVFTRDPSGPPPHRRTNVTVHSNTHAHYLGIPLLIHYRINRGRLGVFLRGGLLGSTRIAQGFTVTDVQTNKPNIWFKSSDRVTDIEDVKPFHLQYLIGAGLEYRITPHYTIYTEPTFSRSLTPLTIIEDVQIGLQTLGIRGGLKMHF